MRGIRGWPAVAVLAAVALYFDREGLFGVVAVAALIAYVVFFAARRMIAGPAGVGRLTGKILAPVPKPGDGSRWGGGAEIPWLYDRIHASAPLAVLELSGSAVAVRVRPKLLARLFGASMRMDAGAVATVYPVRTRLVGYEGIGLDPLDGRAIYFWTSRREELLTALLTAGFPVAWEERLVRS